MALLVIAIVLALIGVGGLAAGAADDDSNDGSSATPGSTTTTEGSSDTSSFVTVTSPTSAGVTTTTRRTATTKAPGTATTQATGECATTSGSGNPGAVKPPALGTYTYASCGSGDKLDIVVTAGQNSGDVTRRNVSAQVEGNGITAHNAYGPNGVTQESATIVLGVSVECDWNPDVVDYPAVLEVGTTWSVNSECALGPNGGKMKETGTRKITGVASLVIGGAAVTGWLIDETEKLVITAKNQSPTTFTSSRTYLFDPTRGVTLYEKVVDEVSGAINQPKTTSERRLTNLTPKT